VQVKKSAKMVPVRAGNKAAIATGAAFKLSVNPPE